MFLGGSDLSIINVTLFFEVFPIEFTIKIIIIVSFFTKLDYKPIVSYLIELVKLWIRRIKHEPLLMNFRLPK